MTGVTQNIADKHDFESTDFGRTVDADGNVIDLAGGYNDLVIDTLNEEGDEEGEIIQTVEDTGEADDSVPF